MKLFLSLALIILSANTAFAGPEDRVNESCYSATKNVPNAVYSTLCFEEVNLNLEKGTVDFMGYATNMPDKMPTETLYRKNEDTYFFVAKRTIINEWGTGCGEALKVDLVVTGEADFVGTIDPKSLSISTLIEETNDTCHSRTQSSSIEYKLSK